MSKGNWTSLFRKVSTKKLNQIMPEVKIPVTLTSMGIHPVSGALVFGWEADEMFFTTRYFTDEVVDENTIYEGLVAAYDSIIEKLYP